MKWLLSALGCFSAGSSPAHSGAPAARARSGATELNVPEHGAPGGAGTAAVRNEPAHTSPASLADRASLAPGASHPLPPAAQPADSASSSAAHDSRSRHGGDVPVGGDLVAAHTWSPLAPPPASPALEPPAPRLSLDCGIGIGPLLPSDPTSPPPPVPGADALSAGGLRTPLVTHMLRGRASLDALLMYGALVRAVDEAAMQNSRLERIESGDLPAGGDDGLAHHHHHQQLTAAARVAARSLHAASASASAATGSPAAAAGGGGDSSGFTFSLPLNSNQNVVAATAAALANSSSGGPAGAAGGGSARSSARSSEESRSPLHHDVMDTRIMDMFVRLVTHASTTTADGGETTLPGASARSSASAAGPALLGAFGRHSIAAAAVAAGEGGSGPLPRLGGGGGGGGGGGRGSGGGVQVGQGRRRSWDVVPAMPIALAAAAAAANSLRFVSSGGNSTAYARSTAAAAAGGVSPGAPPPYPPHAGGGSGSGGGGRGGGSARSSGSGVPLATMGRRRVPPPPPPPPAAHGPMAMLHGAAPIDLELGMASLGMGSIVMEALSRQLSRQLSRGTSGTSLVRLPTGSGSIRDVLSRLQAAAPAPEGSNSGSWSTRTGLASLFDTALTAALRQANAVHTFKRALGGPLSLSRRSTASSYVSQATGTLGQQESSALFSSTAGMSFGQGLPSGPAGLPPHVLGSATGVGPHPPGALGAGVSQLGAAAAAAAALAAAAAAANGAGAAQLHAQPGTRAQGQAAGVGGGGFASGGGGGGPAADVRSALSAAFSNDNLGDLACLSTIPSAMHSGITTSGFLEDTNRSSDPSSVAAAAAAAAAGAAARSSQRPGAPAAHAAAADGSVADSAGASGGGGGGDGSGGAPGGGSSGDGAVEVASSLSGQLRWFVESQHRARQGQHDERPSRHAPPAPLPNRRAQQLPPQAQQLLALFEGRGLGAPADGAAPQESALDPQPMNAHTYAAAATAAAAAAAAAAAGGGPAREPTSSVSLALLGPSPWTTAAAVPLMGPCDSSEGMASAAGCGAPDVAAEDNSMGGLVGGGGGDGGVWRAAASGPSGLPSSGSVAGLAAAVGGGRVGGGSSLHGAAQGADGWELGERPSGGFTFPPADVSGVDLARQRTGGQ